VNRVIRENIQRLETNRYMTLNVIRLDSQGLTLAGKHQDILVWRNDTGAVEQVENDGCWIGVLPETENRVRDQKVALGAGDMALFFTDGVTEATSITGDMFGQERLSAALARVARMPLETAVSTLLADVRTWQSEQQDDITVVLVRRTG
jgi:serine phosphatase RsbU (regulator of sigma subunit)